MPETKFKYYKNYEGNYEIIADVGNVPQGMQEVDYSTFLSGVKQNRPGFSFGGFSNQYDFFKSQNVKGLDDPNVGTGYQMIGGVPTSTKSIEDTAKYEALVAQGLATKVPVGGGFGYKLTSSQGQAPIQGTQTPTQGTQPGYAVPAGSNLTRSAQAMGITLQQLLDANPQYKANPNMVSAGAMLNYPQTSAPTTPTDRQTQLDAMRLQLQDAQRQVNALGSGVPTTSTSPTTALNVGEINQLGAPAKQVDSAGASSVAAGIATTPTMDAYLAQIKQIKADKLALDTQATKGLGGMFAGKPEPLDFAAINKQALEALGLPADFTKQQFQSLATNAAEIKELNLKMNEINKLEQTSMMNIEGQPIPMENISRQQSDVQRKYAIQKSSIAADITVKAAYENSLRGNFLMVSQLIDKAITYATHIQDQKISDYRWMYDNYEDQMKALTTREQTLYDNLLKSMEAEVKETKADLRWKAELYINNKIAIPSFADLGKMSVQEVASYVSRNIPKDAVGTGTSTTIYDTTLQGYLSQGMSPDQAVLAIIAATGENLTEKEKTAMLRRAEVLQKATITSPSTKTTEIQLSKLAQRVKEKQAQNVKMGFVKNLGLRDELIKEGFNPQDVSKAVPTIEQQIGGFFQGIYNSLFGK